MFERRVALLTALGDCQQPKVLPRQAGWMMWGELLIAPVVRKRAGWAPVDLDSVLPGRCIRLHRCPEVD